VRHNLRVHPQPNGRLTELDEIVVAIGKAQGNRQVHRQGEKKPSGKLIVTVPLGRFVDYGWFTHYESKAIATLFQSIPAARINAEYFKSTKDGWMPFAAAELAEISYGDNGAPAAAGLACFEITKPTPSKLEP
jgi:hypothetical protein